MDLPLLDIRVIDLTVAPAGPTCVRQLADWGADVIRLEPPDSRDSLGGNRHGSDFQQLHRNKRSLSLDLKSPAVRDVLMRLVDTADVLIENMRPPVKERLGFGYEAVHARNPRLVYGSISGFGQDGVAALMNLIGPGRAVEVLFSARRFSADEALRMGLVDQVVPATGLHQTVFGLAEAISRNPPLAIAAAKAAIREATLPTEQRDLARIEAMVEACFRSADHLEGQRAFTEKRPPAFTGH